MYDAYENDLATIHDSGFGQLAVDAAAMAVKELTRYGVESGTVVDLGCGSGISSRLFCDAGFEVLGIDLSESMIEMARERVPEAEFRIGSFLSAELPPCVAVTAVGEVFNYAFDTANGPAERTKVLERIFSSLAPGGLLAFDMAGYDRVPPGLPHQKFVEGSPSATDRRPGATLGFIPWRGRDLIVGRNDRKRSSGSTCQRTLASPELRGACSGLLVDSWKTSHAGSAMALWLRPRRVRKVFHEQTHLSLAADCPIRI